MCRCWLDVNQVNIFFYYVAFLWAGPKSRLQSQQRQNHKKEMRRMHISLCIRRILIFSLWFALSAQFHKQFALYFLNGDFVFSQKPAKAQIKVFVN